MAVPFLKSFACVLLRILSFPWGFLVMVMNCRPASCFPSSSLSGEVDDCASLILGGAGLRGGRFRKFGNVEGLIGLYGPPTGPVIGAPRGTPGGPLIFPGINLGVSNIWQTRQ